MAPDQQDGLERITLAEGENVFMEGEPGKDAYIVESGVIEISRSVNGDKVTLGIVEKDGFFGEMALIDESERIATATATTEAVCIPIPKIAIQMQLKNADPLLRKLVQVLLSNVRSLSDQIAKTMGENDEKP